MTAPATATVPAETPSPTEAANDNARASGRVAWYRNYHRYYDPATGRYVQVEPLSQEPDDVLMQVVIGVPLHAYAYAMSSPSVFVDVDGLKPGARFPTRDRAAVDALQYINPKSKKLNREFGGMLCVDLTSGKYFATEPKMGTSNSCSPDKSPCPEGSEPVADYHTHGRWSRVSVEHRPEGDIDWNEQFSDKDLRRSQSLKRDGYLGTPKDKYWLYRWSANEQSRVFP